MKKENQFQKFLQYAFVQEPFCQFLIEQQGSLKASGKYKQ
jgi:hypothetical protein